MARDESRSGATASNHHAPPASRGPESNGNALPSDQITAMASRSADQVEFLELLAAELSSQFPISIIAMMHPSWDSPMMRVKDPSMADRVGHALITQVLQTSTPAPAACDIPLLPAPDVPDRPTRGLHVQLLGQSPTPCAVLMIYHQNESPDPLTQFQHLKQLAEYTSPCRIALANLPAKAKLATSTALTAATGPASRENRRALRTFHQDLDPIATAFRIANETRRVLSADRVSVLIAKRGRLKVQAVSGVSVIDRRANSIAAAEAFAERVIVLGRSIVLPSEEPLPPQIAGPLDDYLDQTDVTSVAVVPLYREPRADSDNEEADSTMPDSSFYTDDNSGEQDPIGVMLIESFSGSNGKNLSPAIHDVAAEASLALANSLDHDRIFGRRFLQAMGDWFGGRRLPYTIIAVLGLAAMMIASVVIQVDHKIIATGTAEPTAQQNVFARTDGIVKEILVRDGQNVQQGDVLFRLENADLETSAETLAGDIQTKSRRLASIGSMLLDPGTDPKQAGRLAIEQRQLKSELSSLEKQLKLVQDQLAELTITAPIDGVISGWQLERRLGGRPVGRGNQLLSIVDADGPWQLRLEIPDADAAEVVAAMDSSGPLAVQFAAASHPDQTFAGRLSSIATSARRNANGVNVIDAIATIQSGNEALAEIELESFVASEIRTGVETTAKIVCGRKSALASWFGDVSDFFHRNVLFYLR